MDINVLNDEDDCEFIGEMTNGISSLDTDYHAEELYREQDGSYFLISITGARGKYTGVYPLSEEEANEWIAEYKKTQKKDCSN